MKSLDPIYSWNSWGWTLPWGSIRYTLITLGPDYKETRKMVKARSTASLAEMVKSRFNEGPALKQ